MKNIKLIGIALWCGLFTACTQKNNPEKEQAQDQQLARIEARVDDLKPGLGDIMSIIQQHHTKLYFSGNASNWELAEYELVEIREGLEDAAKFHPTFKSVKTPLSELIPSLTKNEMDGVAGAIKSKNQRQFTQAFQSLTVACNHCHQTAEHSFIVIQAPTGAEFTNQKFTK